MRFSDLLAIPRDTADVLDWNATKRALPNVPEGVLAQLVIEHPAKDELQEQYGHLDLNVSTWSQ